MVSPAGERPPGVRAILSCEQLQPALEVGQGVGVATSGISCAPPAVKVRVIPRSCHSVFKRCGTEGGKVCVCGGGSATRVQCRVAHVLKVFYSVIYGIIRSTSQWHLVQLKTVHVAI